MLETSEILKVSGPSWLVNQFFGEDIPEGVDGPLDRSRTVMEFDETHDKPLAVFNMIMGLVSCSRAIYSYYLEGLLDPLRLQDW